jgi:hypothetical protein
VWSNHFRDSLRKAAANEPEIARKFYVLAGKGEMSSITMRTATRKYFFTQVSKKVGLDFAHCWTGHKLHIGTYLRLSLEEKQELFRQCIPALTMYTDVENDKTKLLHDVLLNVELLVEDPTQREAIKKELSQLDPRATKEDILGRVRILLRENKNDPLVKWVLSEKGSQEMPPPSLAQTGSAQTPKKRIYCKPDEVEKYLDTYTPVFEMANGNVVLEYKP